MDLVRSGVLLHDAPADPASLAKLAEAIVNVDPHVQWFLHVLGAAYYRAGNYEQAVQRLEESLTTDPNWSGRAINYPFLAMAYHRLGRQGDARNALAEAERALDQWTDARYEASESGSWVISQGATDYWPVLWWDWMACQVAYGEARSALGLSPPPDDFRQHVLRARAFAGLRWPEKALQEYAAALKGSPDDEQILLETHRTRAYLCVLRRQWNDAAAEYARASKLQPDEPYFWEYQAVLNLASGNKDSYRQICAAMLDHFGANEDPRAAHSVVAACTLLQDALPDMGQLIPVGQIAARWYPGSGRMLAAAHCRAGAYDEAVRGFHQAAAHYRLRADDLLMLTIAYHHLGNDAQAQHCFSKALRWIEEAGRQQLNEPAGTRPGWGDWQEPICVDLRRREAQTLLK